jgi:hypothetical protein
MNRSRLRLILFLAAALLALWERGGVERSAMARSASPGAQMANAARDFLATLSSEQRARAVFPFASEERQNWHFVPQPRKGLPLKEMDARQREAAHAFLRAVLSQKGYTKATTIFHLEEVLRALEGGRGPARDPELYYFSFFGEPGEEATWGWRVEGHHLSLNLTVVKGRLIASTPQFFGANPAEVAAEGPMHGVRALAPEEDVARELVHALTPEQRARALIGEAPRDIVTGASRRAEIGEPKGLPAGEMTKKQRQLLQSLLDVYAAAMPADVARERLARLRKAGTEKVHFAWAGGLEHGQPHYYRLQGPTFLVEYDNTQNRANHIHTVWRDFRGDWGEDLLAAHYRQYPHGGIHVASHRTGR